MRVGLAITTEIILLGTFNFNWSRRGISFAVAFVLRYNKSQFESPATVIFEESFIPTRVLNYVSKR